MTTSVPPRSPDLRAAVSAALAGCPPSRKCLVGVSGGRDSMVLLEVLASLGYRKLVVCNLDHGLRGAASRADAKFVLRAASRLGLAAESARSRTREFAKTRKMSLELAARELRYAFFTECARRHRCRRILLAHHADDQVETCLFNYLRGSGPAGLGGMRSVSQSRGLQIFRPMLGVTRVEITSWAEENGITWREDATNLDPVHTRNHLRHRVLPVITEAVGPAFPAAILRAAEILQAEEDWMASLVPEIGEMLSVRELAAMPLAMQRRVVRKWLIFHKIPEASFEEVVRVLGLLDLVDGPAKINLPAGRHVRRRAGWIFMETPAK